MAGERTAPGELDGMQAEQLRIYAAELASLYGLLRSRSGAWFSAEERLQSNGQHAESLEQALSAAHTCARVMTSVDLSAAEQRAVAERLLALLQGALASLREHTVASSAAGRHDLGLTALLRDELYAAASMYGWDVHVDTDRVSLSSSTSTAAYLVVREALRNRYGDEIIDSRGEVDRGRMGDIVFTRSDELDWLEMLLHPRVREAWEDRVGRCPSAAWVVEIPLLFEKNLEKSFDFTVCVSASRAVQYARLARAGHSEEQIKARSSRQLPLSEKILRADFVISNNGTIQFVREQTDQLFEQLGLSSV